MSNWIEGAIKHKGGLHKSLGIKAGTKIPKTKIEAAAKKSGTVGKQARLAETLEGMHHGKSMKKEDEKKKKHHHKAEDKKKEAPKKKMGLKKKEAPKKKTGLKVKDDAFEPGKFKAGKADAEMALKTPGKMKGKTPKMTKKPPKGGGKIKGDGKGSGLPTIEGFNSR